MLLHFILNSLFLPYFGPIYDYVDYVPEAQCNKYQSITRQEACGFPSQWSLEFCMDFSKNGF